MEFISSIMDAMRSESIQPPDHLDFDGQLHRFSTNGKKGDKSGWYVLFNTNGFAAGCFGDWRLDKKVNWHCKSEQQCSPQERQELARMLADAKKARLEKIQEEHALAALTANEIWAQASEATAHPYLTRKDIMPNGCRLSGDNLVIPVLGDNGVIQSIQTIAPNGTKRFLSGAKVKGGYWILGDINTAHNRLYIAEGFATAASIYEATGVTTLVAFSASNITNVAGLFAASHKMVIVADNDESGVGLKAAKSTAKEHNCGWVELPVIGDANDFAARHGKEMLKDFLGRIKHHDDWLIPSDEFIANQQSVKWLIKHTLQAEALIMVHGPSGSGKSFVVLDWCLHIATKQPEWNGKKIRNKGSVVYLAGEGHIGLQSRIAAWQAYHGVVPDGMWVSPTGCDIDAPDGLKRVLTALARLPSKPCLVVVDTLHRFMLGDENKTTDVKRVLDSCAIIQSQFQCSVLLVHHTGVSDTAQSRPRGSSAWKGSLDGEFNIVPRNDKEGTTPKIVNKKFKDIPGQLFMDTTFKLVPVSIPNWYDEDGDQVVGAVVDLRPEPVIEVETLVQARDPVILDKKVKVAIEMFEAIWRSGGEKMVGDSKYVTREAALLYLQDVLGFKLDSAKTYLYPSGKFIGVLTQAKVITGYEAGWVLTTTN